MSNDKKSSRSFNLDKGGNRSFDLEKKPTRSFDLSKDERDSASKTVAPVANKQNQSAHSIQDQTAAGGDNGGNKKKWALVILAVLVLAALAYWLMPAGGNADSSQTIVPDSVSAASTDSTADKASTDSVVKDTAATSVQQSEPDVQKEVQESVPSGQPKASPEAKSQSESEPSVSDAPTGSIDEQARQVIKGTYGNNPVRRYKLGADYHAIQKRVNELMRK